MNKVAVYDVTEKYELLHELGICGCCIPEEAYKAVFEMLKRVKNREKIVESDSPYELFMAYTLDNLELLEHGSSIYGSWLTDKGEKMIEALEVFEKYEFDWNIASDCMPNEFWVLEKYI